MRTGIHRMIVALIAAAPILGCHASHESRLERDRTVIVHSTTQPGDDALDTAGAREIRVILDEEQAPTSPGSSGAADFVGKRCRVQFRRDALGLSAIAPTSPQSEGLPNKPTYLDGMFTRVARDGVLLKPDDGGEVWIPWQSVLLIERRD